MLLMFPKTADYIPSGGVIATLLGCALSVTVMENVGAARSFESFQRKHGFVGDNCLESRHTLFLIS